jgi:hypothetical protein
MPREVRNFRVVNPSTVNLRARGDVYRIDTAGVCPELSWTNRIELATTGSSWVCVGSGLGTSIVTRGPRGRQRCPIRTITALTREEVEALPARARP